MSVYDLQEATFSHIHVPFLHIAEIASCESIPLETEDLLLLHRSFLAFNCVRQALKERHPRYQQLHVSTEYAPHHCHRVVMDPRAIAKNYIGQLIAKPQGLKALLLDDETIGIISLLYSQSELLSNEVIFIDKLNNPPGRSIPRITALVFVRPTAENVHALRNELLHPHFTSYKLFFTNTIRRTHVEEIADADAHECVTEVREYYADYYPLSSTLLSFNVVPCLPIMRSTGTTMHNPSVERTVDAIAAIVLSLKLAPQVRFQATSPLCHNVAQRLCVRFDQERSLFEFRPRKPRPLLLIVDRREDPVTPLLNQWTYEAMLHELIGLNFNRVSLKDAPNVPDEFRELVLDDEEDDFYRQNRYLNFGDLGTNLQKLVDAFHTESKSNSRIGTIDEMMKFVSNYPEFRKSSSNVSKHVALAGELSRLVGHMNLLEVSQLEQDLACREAESEHRKQVMDMLKMNNVTLSDKLRLVMLYALRYEGANDKGLPLMRDALHHAGVGPEGIHLITAVKEYAGVSKRSGDIFSNRSFFAMASNTVRRGIGGVDNVYTQHEPLLSYTLDNLFRNRLKNSDFPLVRADESLNGGNIMSASNDVATIAAPRELIVVIAGGATYEESKCVSAVNGGAGAFVPPEGSVTASAAAAIRQLKGRVILAGTCVHNSTSFAVEITRNSNALRQEHFVRPR